MSALVHALLKAPVVSVELRPPRAELDAAAGRDAWIDTYHAVRGLVRAGTFVFLTDSAVGAREEHNLRHLVINLGTDVPRDHVVPFLTTKHSLDFCLSYADRAWQEGFRSLVVLGGDRTVGPPRCVNHAWELRRQIVRIERSRQHHSARRGMPCSSRISRTALSPIRSRSSRPGSSTAASPRATRSAFA